MRCGFLVHPIIIRVFYSRRAILRPGHLRAMSSTQASDMVATPWHAAYQAPRNAEPESLTREQVLEMLKSNGSSRGTGKFLLVDLRRNDHEVCRVRLPPNQGPANEGVDREEQFVGLSTCQHRAYIRASQACMISSRLPVYRRSSGTAVSRAISA